MSKQNESTIDNSFLLESKRHPHGYANEFDNILDPVNFSGLISAVHCNCPKINEAAVKREAKAILEICIQDYWGMIEANMEEIIEAAKKGCESY